MSDDHGTHRTKHHLNNLSIDVRPDTGTARSHCDWTVLEGDGTGGRIEVSLSGRCADTFENFEGRWRFTDRPITVDLETHPSPEVPR